MTELARETRVRIESVRVVGRYRKDLGDIDDLAKSITDIGLINPITVTPDMRLIAGQRRIEAHRRLGLDTIPARVVDNLDDATDRLRAEQDENTCRKEMTVSERVALAQALEELERPKAEERRREAAVKAGRASAAVRSGQPTLGSPEPKVGENAGRTAEIAAEAVGMSPSSYKRARAVVEAAQDPALPPAERAIARAAAEDMDVTGNVAGNYEKVRGARSSLSGKPKKTVMQSAAQQRRAITAATDALGGICHGLRQITELHDDITCEEAAQWVDGLSESRRAIDVLIKRLKERTNASA